MSQVSVLESLLEEAKAARAERLALGHELRAAILGLVEPFRDQLGLQVQTEPTNDGYWELCVGSHPLDPTVTHFASKEGELIGDSNTPIGAREAEELLEALRKTLEQMIREDRAEASASSKLLAKIEAVTG